MNMRFLGVASLILFLLPAARVQGGGSGLNVIVVVNQNSTNSVQLGNYYCEKRQVPPQNVLRINWTGNSTDWSVAQFNTYLFGPLTTLLASNQLTNQIDYVLLSMDIPYRTWVSGSVGNGTNGTTSALYYGFKPDVNPPCSIAAGSANAYAGSESIFRYTPPISAASNSFIVTMITDSNLDVAKRTVDQGVTSDGSFPTQTVFLAKSPDTDRNVRFVLFDNAIFNARVRGNYSMARTNTDTFYFLPTPLGTETGVYYASPPLSYVPGAIGDNLTSFGGLLFEYSAGQLDILRFLEGGASGAYGTVYEPCNYLQKFPTPQVYFYQARGFSLGECYYQSITNPYQGILLGEPLAAPFAQPASGGWINLPASSLLSGTTNLSLEAFASDSNHPVQQIDLFIDGTWSRTLTNLPPQANNVLSVTINGFPTNYTVPANATIKTVASNLTARLNQSTYSNATKVLAIAHGDRIELQSMDRTRHGDVQSVTASTAGGGAALTTGITASRPTFLDSAAQGIRGFQINGTPGNGTYLQMIVTKTNGTQVSIAVTNTSGLTLWQLTSRFVDMINTNNAPGVTGPDGLAAGDLVTNVSTSQAEFNVLANSAGWDAAQIQADLNGPGLTISPSASSRLDENVPDLRPRNHLYINAGVADLPLTFAFNTTTQMDGYHDLTAVTYEGTHVRTQKRIAQTVRIQNSPLSAVFTQTLGGTNTLLAQPVQFSVVPNTNTVTKIELFSTGGSLTNVTGQSSATFSVLGANLGIGLHPFYAIVTISGGKQYRTETRWVRFVGTESPFSVSVTAPPPTLYWPATAGRSYDVLSATDLAATFQLRATVTPTNSSGQWTDNAASETARFYRVQTAP